MKKTQLSFKPASLSLKEPNRSLDTCERKNLFMKFALKALHSEQFLEEKEEMMLDWKLMDLTACSSFFHKELSLVWSWNNVKIRPNKDHTESLKIIAAVEFQTFKGGWRIRRQRESLVSLERSWVKYSLRKWSERPSWTFFVGVGALLCQKGLSFLHHYLTHNDFHHICTFTVELLQWEDLELFIEMGIDKIFLISMLLSILLSLPPVNFLCTKC